MSRVKIVVYGPTSPPIVVLTPLAALTAVLPNEADTGIDWKNDPKRLAAPSATIS